MEKEDWLVLLTGGLVSSGAIGWIVYRDIKSQQLDSKAIMTIAASFVGGMGIYFTGSALIYRWRKSSQEKLITSEKDAPDLTALDSEYALCERFDNVMNELERNLDFDASRNGEYQGLDKTTLTNTVQETVEVPCRLGGMTKKVNDFRRKGPRNELRKRTDNQIKTNEGIRGRKTRFREEILSYINELKGYVQGAINPLPLARNIQIQSTGLSDEMRRQVVTIVQEYANSMVPKLEQVIDEFVDFLCKAMIPDCEKEHKVKKAFEILGVSEKDLSTALLKIEMDQYYDTLENSKIKSQMSSCRNGHRPKLALRTNMQPLNSISSPSLNEENALVETAELSLPVMPKLATPTSTGIPFKSKEANKSDRRPFEKTKISPSNPPVLLPCLFTYF
ncbi:unnamed protein product [Larinioides sclopetarius]|uniref:Uncharacterized protein n=1 Tax=Larinioides sclopetarius TaxID=280406 RepID=A0AAV2BVQ9_9ARAC